MLKNCLVVYHPNWILRMKMFFSLHPWPLFSIFLWDGIHGEATCHRCNANQFRRFWSSYWSSPRWRWIWASRCWVRSQPWDSKVPSKLLRVFVEKIFCFFLCFFLIKWIHGWRIVEILFLIVIFMNAATGYI